MKFKTFRTQVISWGMDEERGLNILLHASRFPGWDNDVPTGRADGFSGGVTAKELQAGQWILVGEDCCWFTVEGKTVGLCYWSRGEAEELYEATGEEFTLLDSQDWFLDQECLL